MKIKYLDDKFLKSAREWKNAERYKIGVKKNEFRTTVWKY